MSFLPIISKAVIAYLVCSKKSRCSRDGQYILQKPDSQVKNPGRIYNISATVGTQPVGSTALFQVATQEVRMHVNAFFHPGSHSGQSDYSGDTVNVEIDLGRCMTDEANKKKACLVKRTQDETVTIDRATFGCGQPQTRLKKRRRPRSSPGNCGVV